MSADRKFLYGQKARLIVDMIVAGGPKGADPRDISRELRTTTRSIAQIVVRARGDGVQITSQRYQGHSVRYYGPGMQPVDPDGVTTSERIAMDEVRDRLVAAGPYGLLREDARADMTRSRFAAALTNLRKASKLHNSPPQIIPYRLFAEAEFVPVYVAPPKPSKAPKPKPEPKPKPARVAGLQDVRINATAPHWHNLPPKPAPVVIVPENVKRTYGICPQFDDRYQVDPKTRVIGGFASMGIGRYLEDRA